MGSLFEEDDEFSQRVYLAVYEKLVKAGYKPLRSSIYEWTSPVITIVCELHSIDEKDIPYMYGTSFDEIVEKTAQLVMCDINNDKDGMVKVLENK